MNSPLRKKRIQSKKVLDRINRGGHLIMAFYFAVFNMIPQNTFALSGGPSQPEVQSFEPIGTSEMVDLFSGDFVYNLPLLDVGGYPINLSYHSGISTDQEASWVGLGWNVNPGTINRGMRGIPDDFDGDLIHHELNTKPSVTVGVNAGLDFELLGLPDGGIGVGTSLGVNAGIKYNNYRGIGTEAGLDLSVSVGNKNKGSLTGGLGLNSSSDEGLSLQPSLSLSVNTKEKSSTSLGATVGTSINSRSGMQQLSINASITKKYEKTNDKGKTKKSSLSLGLASASFNYGQPTFSPQVGMQMKSFSMTARFKGGGELFGADIGAHFSGYYNSQGLSESGRNWDNPAYGYFNSENGQKMANATMDFNREKDGSFTTTTPGLPLTNFTYDIYSVSGQGVGGSYRPFRSDIGYVFDPKSKSTSSSKSIGVEISTGQTVHGGGNITVVNSNQLSGKWDKNGNKVADVLAFNQDKKYADYEPYYLKEANEKSVSSDSEFFESIGGSDPVQLQLKHVAKFETHLEPKFKKNDGTELSIQKNHRVKREKRNQILTFLNRKQMEDGLGLLPPHPNSFNAPDHHVAEITTLNTSGERYIYGIAAYNLKQEDVTFAIGANLNKSNGLYGNYEIGLTTYNPGVDDSPNNSHGIDNYYSRTVTPAYAHSYLLTCILSSDYVDSDDIKGPSDGDLGTYTKFEYKKTNLYKWRTPIGKNTANFNDGLKSDQYDDKASYTYGEKEIWYLEKVITKNHIAVFTLTDRTDAHSVVNNAGMMDANPIMQKISKISLYSKKDYENNSSTALPIKVVHFEYDYSLCQGVPNSSTSEGKLTLKKVYFTYQNSTKGAKSKYEFEYATTSDGTIVNPVYNIKSYDRWGNYKLNDVTSSYNNGSPKIPAAEFPYVDQNQVIQDRNATAWNLSSIKLPSGGRISVDYESDDYAYVQNKKAQQMVKIVGTSTTNTLPTLDDVGNTNLLSSVLSQSNNYLIVEIPSEYNDDFSGLLAGNWENMYFRCLVNTLPSTSSSIDKYDYVSGYADIHDAGQIAGTNYGYIHLKEAKFGDTFPSGANPISVAAIQYSRLHLSKFVWNTSAIGEPMNFGKQLLQSMLQTLENFSGGFGNQNKRLWESGVGNKMIVGKSWIRLNVKNKKLGGGTRVHKVTISDEWSNLAGGLQAEYGQEYEYKLKDGTSSGVAAYEPQLGGDENPWRQPVYYSKRLLLAPDERMYQETPYGESFFPSASVGYSRVTVKNIKPDGVDLTNHATGSVVNEFYTSKDFPTIPKRTTVKLVRDKSNPLSVLSLFKVASRDYMTATQGFSIELNDMNGKPKGTFVYAEGNDEPISSQEFYYKSKPYLGNSYQLENEAKTVDKNGNVSTSQIGVMFDMVADFRRQTSSTSSTTINANFDMFLLGIFPVPIPIVFGSSSEDKVQFHSATTTKVVQRFGLLDKTVIKDLGSSVTTKTIAYDTETGNELISETTNNFDDKIYNLKFPAYWYYENMGQAYKNIGFEADNLNFSNGIAQYPNAIDYFFKGDELEVVGQGTRVWISNVGQNNILAIKRDGSKYNGTGQSVRVLRSGRKNMMDGEMASLTSYTNPISSIKTNVYQNVVQASAIEFTDKWRTFCDCADDGAGNLATTNPYVLGAKGNYKPKATYSYLTERTQELSEDNLNIRRDGVYESFTPFYLLASANKWKKDYQNWTFTEKITEFNPNGGQLESRDALGRYSGETYGYNNSVVTASAGNAKYSEVGFDGFEDHLYVTCADQHFRFNGDLENEGHTGKMSLKVKSGQPVVLSKDIDWCGLVDCNMEVTSMEIGGYIYYKVENAESPIDVQWSVLSGNPVVLPSTNSTYIVQVKNTPGFEVRLDFTDNNGCQASSVVVK